MAVLFGESEADPRRADTHTATSIHDAAGRGNREQVERLIREGADVDAVDEDGLTAFYCAGERGQLEAVEVLAAHGAVVELLRHGAKRRIKNKRGETLLDEATRTKHEAVAAQLGSTS